jgi:alpha-L-fucosidase
MRGAILTAKHHDGFCLWPSRYTAHSVKNSPWKNGQGDVVGDLATACREAGLKLGLYLSPWDRHEPVYGDSPRYNTFFLNQLTELMTQYGELFCLWFDGACGEGPNGKRQVYDWEAYYERIRELQPNAVISVMGPDVRWCGNEAGKVRESEWSVVPAEMFDQARIAGDSQQTDEGRFAERLEMWTPDLGSRERIGQANK